MSQKQGRTGYVAAGLGWGIALGLAAGLLVVGPAMGVVEWDPQHSPGNTSLAQSASDSELAALKNEQADKLIGAQYEKLLAGALEGEQVIILRTSDAVETDVDAVKWQLMTAGAKSAGEIRFTSQLTDQDHADALSKVIATTLPAGAALSVEERSPGAHMAQSLGAVIFADPATGEPAISESDRKFVIEALKGGGFIEEALLEAPATAAVLITGDAPNNAKSGFGKQVLLDATESFAKKRATVLAGPVAAWETGNVAAIPFIDTEAGRVLTVLELADMIAGSNAE